MVVEQDQYKLINRKNGDTEQTVGHCKNVIKQWFPNYFFPLVELFKKILCGIPTCKVDQSKLLCLGIGMLPDLHLPST